MKKLLIINIFILLIFVFSPSISIAGESESTPGLGEVIQQADDFLKEGDKERQKDTQNSQLKNANDIIFNTLFSIGIAITVIWGGFLGIEFMLASAEDKAQIKQMLLPYIAGCFVIYGAFGIWKVVVAIFDKIA